ncbi:MAG: hypothetical protein IJO32_01645 [Bacilli bacterium]|nr:hypothetical protein [Bacilli bacterium]
MKKKKQLNVTKQNMREYGFTDGYSGRKSQENEWIRRLVKRKMNTTVIKEYIESYRTGYKVGQYTLNGLDNTKIKDGEVYYNNQLINEKVGDNEINQKIKSLTPKKKKEGK